MYDKITISNAWICQIKGNSVVPVFGDLIVEAGRIKNIHKKAFKSWLESKNENTKSDYDAEGRVITIPLINFHDHIYSRLAKGLPVSGPMNNFRQILNNLWWKLDKVLDMEMIIASAKMAAIESIRNGVIYIFDHHSSPNASRNSLSTIAKILSEFGLRGTLCFETTDRNGSLLSEEGLKENLNFLKNNYDFKGMFGLHASFTINNETLSKVSKIIEQTDAGIHIHLSEDNCDRELTVEKFNLTPLQRFEHYKLLSEKSILSHGIHLDKRDREIIKKYNSAIAFNIDSNLNNSVGLPDVELNLNSALGLIGTDGMHANIAKSMKQFFLCMRKTGLSFDKSFTLFKKMYFDQIYFIKNYFNDFTLLTQNDRADFIIWDYTPPTPFNEENFWGHFIYGILERNILSVIQNGKFLLKNFEIENIDENEINKDIFVQGERLFTKFQ